MRFTKNQVKVMQWCSDGMTFSEIAKRKRVSPWTIKATMVQLREKLDVQDKTQMAIKAFCLGLVK